MPPTSQHNRQAPDCPGLGRLQSVSQPSSDCGGQGLVSPSNALLLGNVKVVSHHPRHLLVPPVPGEQEPDDALILLPPELCLVAGRYLLYEGPDLPHQHAGAEDVLLGGSRGITVGQPWHHGSSVLPCWNSLARFFTSPWMPSNTACLGPAVSGV